MTKAIQGCAEASDNETLAIEEAEADFILAVQTEIQKLLNAKGLRARDLSKRLQVTEARISQMFGDQAKNLTLRTIARIFFHLGEAPHICTIAEMKHAALGASDGMAEGEERWTVRGIVGDLQVAPNIALGEPAIGFDPGSSGDILNRWVRAEGAEAGRPRRISAAR